MKYLGIDYGTKRVGIATSDDEGRMAFPFRVLPNSKTLTTEIGDICRSEHIGTVVIGESHDFENKPNPIMREITHFVTAIKEETGLPVEFMTEVLSSREASRITGENSGNDSSAAAIVLQSYIDRAHEHPLP
jgi:putative Holliday junction resolvase